MMFSQSRISPTYRSVKSGAWNLSGEEDYRLWHVQEYCNWSMYRAGAFKYLPAHRHQQSVHELESLYTSHSVHSIPSTGVYAQGSLYSASHFMSLWQLSWCSSHRRCNSWSERDVKRCIWVAVGSKALRYALPLQIRIVTSLSRKDRCMHSGNALECRSHIGTILSKWRRGASSTWTDLWNISGVCNATRRQVLQTRKRTSGGISGDKA